MLFWPSFRDSAKNCAVSLVNILAHIKNVKSPVVFMLPRWISPLVSLISASNAAYRKKNRKRTIFHTFKVSFRSLIVVVFTTICIVSVMLNASFYITVETNAIFNTFWKFISTLYLATSVSSVHITSGRRIKNNATLWHSIHDYATLNKRHITPRSWRRASVCSFVEWH